MQADKGLGKSFSALLPLVVGLHALGYLENEDYEVYKSKYSVGLDVEPLTPTQIEQNETKKNRDRQLNRHYEEVLKQWDNLKDKTKRYHLEKAEKDKHLKYAKLLLKKAEAQ